MTAITFRKRTDAKRVRLYCAGNGQLDAHRVSVNVWLPAGADRWAIRYFHQGEPVHVDRDSASLRNARAVVARVLTRTDLTTAAAVMFAAIDARLDQNAAESSPSAA